MGKKKLFKPISVKTNDPKTEPSSRPKYSSNGCQPSASHPSLIQDSQLYFNDHHQNELLYLIQNKNNDTKLFVYNTSSEKEEIRILDAQERIDVCTSITQLPNDEIFCFGNWPCYGITLIIDRNYNARILPSGESCSLSSGIYFKANVYCFGGRKYGQRSTLSMKFNLNKNQWVNLPQMPNHDECCHSIIFNGNILISGLSRKLLLYSIDINSFSTISYDFALEHRKILINSGRLYLIECGGFIYESEDEYNWKKISNSIISSKCPAQVYCLYNRGGIYIAAQSLSHHNYYKFDMVRRIMINL